VSPICLHIRKGKKTHTSKPYVWITSKQLRANAFILSSELAKSEKRCCVGGSLNDQPPMERKTFSSGFELFSAVVRRHRSASPGVISTFSNDLRIMLSSAFSHARERTRDVRGDETKREIDVRERRDVDLLRVEALALAGGSPALIVAYAPLERAILVDAA
jgi:hypothetical protein